MADAVRVLLVEDDVSMAQMLGAYLGRKRFAVTHAPDGEAALAALKGGEGFDLVLSDIRMPGASGLDVLAAAREGDHPPAVILMTAYPNVENVIEAMKRGAYGYVRKPIMELDGELGHLMARALQERTLKRHNAELMEKLKRVTAQLAARQKEFQAELEMAGRIQRSLLPDEFVALGGVSVATKRMIGEELSGDFHDVLPLPDGSVGILMGQALGRDLPGAILMASISAHLRELSAQESDPGRVFARANAALHGILKKGYSNFVSAFYGIVSPDRRRFAYACAAQPPPLRIRPGQPLDLLDQPAGPFLGKYADAAFETASSALEPGHRLFFFTENVRSLVNERGSDLSLHQLLAWAAAAPPGQTQAMIEDVAARVRRWSPEAARRNILLMGVDLS